MKTRRGAGVAVAAAGALLVLAPLWPRQEDRPAKRDPIAVVAAPTVDEPRRLDGPEVPVAQPEAPEVPEAPDAKHFGEAIPPTDPLLAPLLAVAPADVAIRARTFAIQWASSPDHAAEAVWRDVLARHERRAGAAFRVRCSPATCEIVSLNPLIAGRLATLDRDIAFPRCFGPTAAPFRSNAGTLVFIPRLPCIS